MSDSFIEVVYKEFIQDFSTQSQQSFAHLRGNVELTDRLEKVRHFGLESFFDGIPSTFDILRKVGFFPFSEAGMDLEFAIANALCGAYKPAYFSLRSFLELGFTGLYFISSSATEAEGKEWVAGVTFTPFFNRSLKRLLLLPEYAASEPHIEYQKMLSDTYNSLSDRTHTRGTPHGHIELNQSNRPQFIEKSFLEFVEMAERCCEALAVTLAIQHPIVLIPLPMNEKFGLNPPLSGFLQEHDVDCLKSFISPKRLRWLETFAANDSNTQGLREWVESQPDLTEDQWQEQIRHQKEFFSQMSRPNITAQSN
ncbi:MAG: hypothetical protein ABL911_11360 [Gallionella sp.]|nr:hypothetical protein [Gallionella sp.]